jgi:hypothetical protein
MKKKPSHKSTKGKLVKNKGEHIPLKEFLANKKIVPGKKERGSGVYALYNGTKLYYIGLSVSSIRQRLRSHSKEGSSKYGNWNNFSFYQMPFKKRSKYVKDIETILISIFDPKHNKQKGKIY